jgi:hypothetical protein
MKRWADVKKERKSCLCTTHVHEKKLIHEQEKVYVSVNDDRC